MISKILATLVCALFIAKVNAQTCDFEKDVDYFGNDLSPDRFLYYPSQDLCCAACQSNSSCQAWTYVKHIFFPKILS
jgi:hypothetical protein